jgi:hypothetical protein
VAREFSLFLEEFAAQESFIVFFLVSNLVFLSSLARSKVACCPFLFELFVTETSLVAVRRERPFGRWSVPECFHGFARLPERFRPRGSHVVGG